MLLDDQRQAFRAPLARGEDLVMPPPQVDGARGRVVARASLQRDDPQPVLDQLERRDGAQSFRALQDVLLDYAAYRYDRQMR